jgi:phospholipid/cholesterol/gamma-HCH transport system substrate-binding protein
VYFCFKFNQLKISKEFKIGLIVLISFALLYWGFNFLKGEDVFSNERIFMAVYSDVGGLDKANPVTINGLTVGHVRDMNFSRDGKAHVVIELIINNSVSIPKNSIARITSSDLLGSKTVDIILGTSHEYAVSGDTLISEMEISIKEEVSRQLKPLKNKAEGLLISIDTVISMLNNLFSKTNTDNISRSVAHIAGSFENLENTTSTLDNLMTEEKTRVERILENVESVSLNLKNNEDKLNTIFNNFSSLSDTLAKARLSETMQKINSTINELSDISKKINSGKGSLGMLINNDSLYIEVEKSSRELKLLLEDIRLNPKKYLKFSVF